MSKPTIIYFSNFPKARGLILRLCFEIAGVEYNNTGPTPEEWGKQKAEGKYLLPFLPALEVDGEILQETFAIMTYIGENYGVLPASAMEKAKCLELMLTLDEIGKKIRPTFQMAEDEKKKAREEIAEGFMKEQLERAEKMVAKRAGKFCFGDKVTVADCFIVWQSFACTQMFDHFPVDTFTKHENLARIIKNTVAIPKVSAVLKEAGFKLE